MAQSDIDVANIALGHLRGKTISSFTQGTREANVADRFYNHTVEVCLSKHDWTFAKGFKALDRNASDPLVGTFWTGAYNLPGNPVPLRLKALYINGHRASYERVEKKIYTNATADDTVVLEYVYRPAEDLWPASFTDYVAAALAADMAYDLTGKSDLKAATEQKAARTLADAKFIDATQRTPRRFRGSRFIAVRG